MRDDVRGVVAAALVRARRARTTPALSAVLESFSRALTSSEELRRALTDPSVDVAQRRGVVNDLLRDRGAQDAAAVVTYVVAAERAAELPAVLAQIDELVGEERDLAQRNEPAPAEPPANRAAVRDRMRGFGELTLARVADVAEVDVIEDELFRFARILEGAPELEAALTDPELPLPPRDAVLRELLHGKVRPATEDLLGYQLRAGRVRSLVRAVDWLVELAALERGRRIAEVRTAVDLDGAQRERLAAALGDASGRTVELRVVVDPAVIGGMTVSLGDTVIDGTVRHRLAQLRDALGVVAPPAA
jgi:F-type H+-transporting ATPase subunit delta